MNIIKTNLKKLRKNKGFTQAQMAEKLGYKNKSGYCMLENGLVKMTIEKAKIISQILETSPEIFFDLEVQDTKTYTA